MKGVEKIRESPVTGSQVELHIGKKPVTGESKRPAFVPEVKLCNLPITDSFTPRLANQSLKVGSSRSNSKRSPRPPPASGGCVMGTKIKRLANKLPQPSPPLQDFVFSQKRKLDFHVDHVVGGNDFSAGVHM